MKTRAAMHSGDNTKRISSCTHPCESTPPARYKINRQAKVPGSPGARLRRSVTAGRGFLGRDSTSSLGVLMFARQRECFSRCWALGWRDFGWMGRGDCLPRRCWQSPSPRLCRSGRSPRFCRQPPPFRPQPPLQQTRCSTAAQSLRREGPGRAGAAGPAREASWGVTLGHGLSGHPHTLRSIERTLFSPVKKGLIKLE